MTENAFKCVVCTEIVPDDDEYKTIKGPDAQRVHGACAFRVDYSAIVGGIAPNVKMRCHQLACMNDAEYRYTWPNMAEMGICEEHAPALKEVIASAGYSIKLIPLNDPDYVHEPIKMNCGQLGCQLEAAYRYTWPGMPEAGVCEGHSDNLKQVASSAGYQLSFDNMV